MTRSTADRLEYLTRIKVLQKQVEKDGAHYGLSLPFAEELEKRHRLLHSEHPNKTLEETFGIAVVWTLAAFVGETGFTIEDSRVVFAVVPKKVWEQLREKA